MKIAIADNCALKFTGDLKAHWERIHEVKYEIGASEFLAQWADVYFIDWWDNNIHYLFNWYKEHPEAKRPKFIVRAIDWDIWTRGIRCQEMVDFVDIIICIAPHMWEHLQHEKDDQTGQPIRFDRKLRLIRPGVNLERFTPKKKQTNGFQIGMVLGDMWWYKNHMGGLDIFSQLFYMNNDFKLHIRGQHEAGQYNPKMFEEYLKSRFIVDHVKLYPPQDDMNEWYENIDILLHPGMKETYCYAVAEAMAKDIPAVVNDFYGSRDIWDKNILYRTHQEAVNKILDYCSERPLGVRDYIKENHNIEKMYERIDDLLWEVHHE